MTSANNLPHDTLTVTKGPEDGVSFSLTSSPLALGRDPTCEVGLRLDITVQPFHARVSLAKGGYRVRRLTGAPVYVEGRGCGKLRSRVLRAGQVVKVGYSEMLLTCSPEGLVATRGSHWMESDFVWTLRILGRYVPRILSWILGRLWSVVRAAARHWFILGAGTVALLAAVFPPFREFLQSAWARILETFRR